QVIAPVAIEVAHDALPEISFLEGAEVVADLRVAHRVVARSVVVHPAAPGGAIDAGPPLAGANRRSGEDSDIHIRVGDDRGGGRDRAPGGNPFLPFHGIARSDVIEIRRAGLGAAVGDAAGVAVVTLIFVAQSARIVAKLVAEHVPATATGNCKVAAPGAPA